MNKKGVEYFYSKEVLKKYYSTSTEWKLNWLEEINRITFSILTPKQREIRESFTVERYEATIESKRKG
jgi:hypothetical protein